ncbi:hypothetical protein V2A60_007196 [Cordyceps javanica]|uniref:Het-s domain-containing protein n=1 Tax=Cordyceps javanica TaxID=43265 RepID=A0A545USU8_9HYPO|nr:het-s domain-containing protein [Cordyceps javanica]TQW04249.1 het-s domain protein [Cordyceps javanica]
METLLPAGGFQLPFQRRLSRLYNDTKKSSDFVQAPVPREKQQDPDAAGLHRKLRIQNDRLIGWGLEWSDPAHQAAEIDESLSRAGLSEVVGSIMSTIKDILAEAEHLWLSGGAGGQGAGGPGSAGKKDKMVPWDRARFEDLVNDFTASVDTLYDLSRTRGAAMRRVSKGGLYKGPGAEGYRAFEPTRLKTPQVIDPAQLTEILPARDLPANVASQRAVVLMSKTAYSEMAQGRTREPWGPLLLEYAAFDSIYSTTGIMPPMSRFEKLSAGLQQDSQRAPGAWSGLPRLLGYFEDMENSRFGLVYRFPSPFDTAIISSYKKSSAHEICTLRTLLANSVQEPPLEAKFRLAYNLANTVFDMHARGVTHGKLTEDNISFCNVTKTDGLAPNAVMDVRRPLISSFDIFAEDNTDGAPHHPLDPRYSAESPLPKSTDDRVLELYALSMMLLSIGLWTSIEALPAEPDGPAFASAMEQLKVKCGGLYTKAVHACWEAVDLEMAGEAVGETLLSQVQMRVSRFLETCCILDGVSGLEQRLNADMQEEAHRETLRREESSGIKPNPKPAQPPTRVSNPDGPPQGNMNLAESPSQTQFMACVKPVSKEPKLKLYSQVPLPAEAVEKWNTILMPQINQALRHFYRKHPESVEISLESIGLSPQQTEPTVLVVCSSVGKVRAILKKRVGDLFDGSTGFALKVCRGHVLRSRRVTDSIKRSMATDDDEVEAVNPKYQERPGNGASIGAWIGDRHLPPVSFGGLVVVDGKTYGMTVHHMLDDPDRDPAGQESRRSAALPISYSTSQFDSTDEGDDDGYELSDTESEPYSDTDITSEYGDDSDDEEDDDEPGDIPGIEPGCGDGYVVTQPALDDVEEDFYPCAETEDEDHLDTFSLGPVYASSGIRRRRDNGLIHEVDWALFEFGDDRLPADNAMAKASGCAAEPPLQPTVLAPSAALPGKRVQCVARTSGAQRGQILPVLCSVKIYGRASPSHTYQVASPEGPRAMGIPGDSGAWIVGVDDGALCGHVLAWSQRKRVAYICPMDVLLLDIAQTLNALEVRLPGGEPVVVLEEETQDCCADEPEESASGDSEVVPALVQETPRVVTPAAAAGMARLTRGLAELNMSVNLKPGIDVSS